MKELFKIFVEGDADKRFISQLLEFLFKTSIDQGNIIKTSRVGIVSFLLKQKKFM